MNRTEYREKIRQDFLDIGSFPIFSFEDESIDRALDSALEDLSRLVPDNKVAEIRSTSDSQSYVYSKTAATTAFTILSLGSPIRIGTVVVTAGAVTYTQNTDYIIDHFNGLITFPTGSAILALANPTTVTITYEKSRNSFSLSSIFQDFRSIESVTMYNGSLPYEHEYRVNTQGNVISFSDRWELPDNYYILISYNARYIFPDDSSDGTVPNFLSELVIKGAEASLLFARALSLELTQSLNYNDLTSLDGIFTQILTDLASGRTNLASAVTNLGLSVTYIASVLTEVQSAFDDIDTQNTNITQVVSDTVAALLSGSQAVDTEVVTDLTAAVAKLTSADSDLTALATNIGSGLAFIDTEVVASIVVAEADIETTAQAYLDAGDNFINTVNVGDSPDRVFASYADTETKMAATVIEGAKARIALATDYLEASKLYADSAENRYHQASILIASAESRLKLGSYYNELASTRIGLIKARIDQIQAYLTKVKILFDNAINIYIAQANGYLKSAEGYQNAVQLQILTINAGVARAGEVRAGGELILNIAERLRIEANRRYQDFNSLIGQRSQTSVSRSDTARQSR